MAYVLLSGRMPFEPKRHFTSPRSWNAAPVTVAHILQLVRLGGYNTNEIFRVDKGFVAQVQGVDGGRRAPMSKGLRAVAKQTVPDEFSSTLQHKRGVLSMGKFEEPHTGTSSFSMLLGDAPSLDGKYTIFGRVVAGDHVLSQLEQLETARARLRECLSEQLAKKGRRGGRLRGRWLFVPALAFAPLRLYLSLVTQPASWLAWLCSSLST